MLILHFLTGFCQQIYNAVIARLKDNIAIIANILYIYPIDSRSKLFERSLFTTMNQFTKNNSYRSNKLNNAPENFGIEGERGRGCLTISNHLVEKLQTKISSLYGLKKPEEINLLTALFVEYLADNLELIHKPAPTKRNNYFPLTCIPSLPIDFPQSAAMPLFLYGDKVCYESLEDYGIVIGRFYAFDRASNQWRWKYLIIDNPDYTTDSCFSTCIYWETELKPLN